MSNFNLSRTLVENINEQNDKINNCIDIVNGLANDEEIKVIQELRINEELRQQNELVRQQNELARQEQYNNNESKFAEINQQLNKNIQYYKDLNFKNNDKKKLIAHRGFGGIYPENTIYSFKESLKYTDEIEFDVMVTSDGKLIIIHDDTVDRTTNGTGSVKSKTLAELKTLDAGYKFYGNTITGIQIPSVDDLFNSVNAEKYNWEIKGYRTIEDVDIMTQYVIDKSLESKVEFSGFFWRDCIPRVRAITDKISFACTVGNQTDFNEAIALCNTVSNLSISMPFTLVNTNNIKTLRDNNISYSVWTFTNNADYEWYKQWDISRIISDVPMEVK